MDTSSYLLGLATIPAFALSLYLLALILRACIRAGSDMGFFIDFGPEKGEEEASEDSTRAMKRYGKYLWSGIYEKRWGAKPFYSTFVSIAGPRRGVTFGRKYLI